MRVLLVEDEVRLADAVRRGLEAEGIRVDVEHDGLDGLWRARAFSYDVVVLDILLPGLDGYRVCRELREGGTETPVLMLTAKSGEFDEADALELGADDFLRKPFSFVVLVARLRALVRRGAHSPTSVLRSGDLAYDLRSRTCTIGHRRVDLTARETDLLEALVRRCGAVVPKLDLLELVWGNEDDRDLNVVEVYVGYLRRKLGPSRIETVRGLGYRLVGA